MVKKEKMEERVWTAPRIIGYVQQQPPQQQQQPPPPQQQQKQQQHKQQRGPTPKTLHPSQSSSTAIVAPDHIIFNNGTPYVRADRVFTKSRVEFLQQQHRIDAIVAPEEAPDSSDYNDDGIHLDLEEEDLVLDLEMEVVEEETTAGDETINAANMLMDAATPTTKKKNKTKKGTKKTVKKTKRPVEALLESVTKAGKKKMAKMTMKKGDEQKKKPKETLVKKMEEKDRGQETATTTAIAAPPAKMMKMSKSVKWAVDATPTLAETSEKKKPQERLLRAGRSNWQLRSAITKNRKKEATGPEPAMKKTPAKKAKKTTPAKKPKATTKTPKTTVDDKKDEQKKPRKRRRLQPLWDRKRKTRKTAPNNDVHSATTGENIHTRDQSTSTGAKKTAGRKKR